MRHERKYSLEGIQYDFLMPLIQLSPASFITSYPDRLIHSLYFDDDQWSSLQRNIDGSPLRNKVRIRWYGAEENTISGGLLEVKSKNGLTGKKQAYDFPDMPLSDLSGISAAVEKILHTGALQPVLLVRYHRAYFVSFDRNIRLTLDREIRYEKPGGAVYPWEGMVLEIKYPPDRETDVAELMQYFPFRLSKHSKYARGMLIDQ